MRTLPLLVLRALLRKGNWLRFQSVLAADTFNNLTFRRLYEHVRRLHAQTASDLNVEALMADLEIAYVDRPEMLGELRELVVEIQEIEEVEPDLLEVKVRDFVQRELAVQAAQYVARHAHSPDFDVNVLLDHATRAVEVGLRLDAEVVDFLESDLSGTSDPGAIRVGLGLSGKLDADLCGGVGVGELAVVLAPPHRGKTSLLCAAGASAAGQGRGVLHISLETHTPKVKRRYDQALTHLTRGALDANQDLVAQGRRVLRAKGGRIWIKDWSHARVTPQDVEATVRRMWASDQLVDYVVVDYLGLMRLGDVRQRAEMRHVYGELCQDMRALAARLGVPVLTAWQVNRAGAGNEFVKMEDVAECWEIVMHADTIMALNRNDAERVGHRARLALLKNREDEVLNTYQVYCDLSRMIVRDVRLEDHVSEAELLVASFQKSNPEVSGA